MTKVPSSSADGEPIQRSRFHQAKTRTDDAEGDHTDVEEARAHRQRSTLRARARRAAGVIAIVLSAMTVPVVVATPAFASSYTCTDANWSDTVCQSLTPTFSCVWHDTGGNWTAVFGYQNTSGYDVIVPVGSQNFMSPGPADGGQLTVFPTGTQVNAFTVPFSPPRMTWTIVGKTATASSSDKTCDSPPVPMLGDAGVMARTVLISLPLLLALARTRRLRLLVASVPTLFRSAA
jgi:hypothetical protein